MSPRDSSSLGPYRKPRADVYTIVLILALLAIMIGCWLLYCEVKDYPDKPPWSGGPSVRLELDHAIPGGEFSPSMVARQSSAIDRWAPDRFPAFLT